MSQSPTGVAGARTRRRTCAGIEFAVAGSAAGGVHRRHPGDRRSLLHVLDRRLHRSDFCCPILWVLASSVVIIVPLGYFPWYWSHGGQTPGMKLMRIKVVRDADGGPVSVGQAILRLVGFWVSTLVFYIGFIWIFIDSRRRGWPDLLGGTIVDLVRTSLTFEGPARAGLTGALARRWYPRPLERWPSG